MILTVYFQALKETDPASHKVTSGRWGKIYGTSLKEKLDLEQGGKIHLPRSYLDSQVWGQGERAEGWEGAQVWASAASLTPLRHRLLSDRITPRRRWQPPGLFYASWLRDKEVFWSQLSVWISCCGSDERINQLSKSFAPAPFLTLQCCIKHSTSPNISWRCTYLKLRTKLPGSYALQQPSPLMANAEIKVFPCGRLDFFSCRRGLSLLTYACKLHFHLAPKVVCIASFCSALGLFRLQFVALGRCGRAGGFTNPVLPPHARSSRMHWLALQ